MNEVELKFHLIGRFKLSKNGAEAKDGIAGVIDDANKNILKKGAPKGRGAEIVSWGVDDTIMVEIRSDRYVRAHDALLRLRKPLAGALGKYRIGIRGIEVEKFTITIPTEKPLKKLKIPFVRSMQYKSGNILLELDITGPQIEGRVPDRIIALIVDKIKSQKYGKKEHWELLWASKEKTPKFTGDPTQELIKRGWIKHGSCRGQWIFGSQITKVFRTFEQIVEEEILKPLGYHEMIFPKVVAWDVWRRSGHAKAIYPEMYYVCPPKTRDEAYWEDVIDHYKVTLEVPLDMIKEKIDKPIGGLCYAQCPPAWGFLEGETLPDDILPICVFDGSGTSHRYESGGIRGIERMDEFHRIELLWIGTPEQIAEHSKKLQKRYKHIFEDVLDLQWRMAWVTPWFMAQEGLGGLPEKKEVGTIDYEAFMPYSKKWMEFQNLSNNGDKYPAGFNVKLQSGKELWSGCSGIGLERWAAAFFAQKGVDPNNWPNKFRKMVGDLPDVFKFL